MSVPATERAEERLTAEIEAPRGKGLLGLGAGFGLPRSLRPSRLTAVVVRDRVRRRVVQELDCDGDPLLAERTLDLIRMDLRAKTLQQYLTDYGIDPARVP
jgi:hypothetical protein